jgi:molybdate-binding protein
MSRRCGCTPGTVHRAYQELSRQGLVSGRPGQGTTVVTAQISAVEPHLRRLDLVHRAEAFLFETLALGHTPAEVEQAVRLALDRWRAVQEGPVPADSQTLRFSGSHDLALTWLAAHFEEIAPGHTLELSFSGSLGGLMAVARGEAEIAGAHLRDTESGEYNTPFLRRLFPGRPVARIGFVWRTVGLILSAGNPLRISRLADLGRPGVRFVNRQPGSGTRVWLDTQLLELRMDPVDVSGYGVEKLTHTAVAQAVAEGEADVGVGLQAAAEVYGLDFEPLARERYDLVALARTLEHPAVVALLSWLRLPATRAALEEMGGYEAADLGLVEVVA